MAADLSKMAAIMLGLTSCMRTAKALARLRGCAGSPGPSLVAFVISTIISGAGSNVLTEPETNVCLMSLGKMSKCLISNYLFFRHVHNSRTSE